MEALYIQRTILDELISRNKVTNEVATQLRENINYNEIVLAHEVSNAHCVQLKPIDNVTLHYLWAFL